MELGNEKDNISLFKFSLMLNLKIKSIQIYPE